MTNETNFEALLTALLKQCNGYPMSDVGPAVSSAAIEVAMMADIPKEQFLRMMSEMWDLSLEEDGDSEVKH